MPGWEWIAPVNAPFSNPKSVDSRRGAGIAAQLTATKGPFASLYQAIAGTLVVDWLFMLGLLALGISLILGLKVKLASYGGVALMILMYLALIPPANNPIIDEHIIYALVLLVLSRINVRDGQPS